VLTRWRTWLTAAFNYCENIGTVKNITMKLDKNDATSIEIQKKFNTVLDKNNGYKKMQIISKILVGQEVTKEGLPEDLNADDITFFKHAPITSVEVERSFSTYKTTIGQSPIFFI
jgi:hypothetical protein